MENSRSGSFQKTDDALVFFVIEAGQGFFDFCVVHYFNHELHESGECEKF